MRALVLGGIAWNTMVYLDRFPDPESRTVFSRGYHDTVGSSGAGKALNLARLGADVTLWGMIGDDDPGTKVRAYLDAAGLTFIPAPDPEGTMRHINLMDDAGERISIFANAGSADLSVEPDVIRPWIDGIDVCAVTIVSACKPFLPVLDDAGVEYWCDLHDYDGENPYHRDFIDGAAHLQITSGLLPDWRSFMERRIEAGTRTVICTHGREGASGLTADEGWVEIPAVPVDPGEVVDTNGAGDAFFAGFVTARHEGAALETAMERGARHAAAAVRSTELAPGRPDGEAA
jgi:sugar/nucleoside kinase (ribokinase family)